MPAGLGTRELHGIGEYYVFAVHQACILLTLGTPLSSLSVKLFLLESNFLFLLPCEQPPVRVSLHGREATVLTCRGCWRNLDVLQEEVLVNVHFLLLCLPLQSKLALDLNFL